MKKKNVLMMALSLCLVAVIAVGGTLAYLTASDGALVNTFTFANNLQVDLYETIGSESEDVGHDYSDVIPGVPVDKDVNFTTNASVKSVVFVKIEAVNKSANGKEGLNMILDMTGTELAAYGTTQNGYGEYYIVVDKGDNSEKNIFAKVTAPTTADATQNVLNDVKISISAVQYEGLEKADYTDQQSVIAAAYAAKPDYQAQSSQG